jgi:uroporphyrinogen decarboxylase
MRFVDACLGRPVDTTPIWVMRQAGRYLPEYRALREKAAFLEMCRTPDLAAEATLQPLRRFDLDAAILFSDILVPVEAMGVPVEFVPEPKLPRPVRTAEDVAALHAFEPGRGTPFVMDAIRRVRAALPSGKALIGFAGAPFTLACYLVEGGGSKDFARTKALMFGRPDLFRDLLARLADAIVPYLAAQIDAGCDAVQLFDTWAGQVSPGDFRRFVLPVVRSIVDRVRRPGVPFVYFVNGVAGVAEDLPSSGADVLGIDYRIELSDAIRRVGPDKVVQGNLDPGVLLGGEAEIRDRAAAIVEAGRAARGHVFNLGHGILQHTPPENLAVLVDQVHLSGRRDA